MPNINFPSSPIAGDTYSFNGVLYIFDGLIWIAQSGIIGPTGPAGFPGPTGATGQGFNYTGNYLSYQNYFPYDVVFYQGSSYVSLVTSTPPHEPDIYPAYWGTLSEKGDPGIQGEIGPTGSQGSIGATGPSGNTSLVFGGVISGATAWSSSNDGTVTLPDVIVGLYDNSEFLGDISTYSVIGGKTGTGSIPALSNNDTNYVFIKYNGGSPVYDIDQSGSTINDSDVVRYMTVYRLNNFVHNLEYGNQGAGLPNKINNRILSVDRFARESGLTIGLSGSSGIVTLSSGVAWNGTFRQNIAAVNSADDIFFKNYHVGGVWTYSTTSDYLNNTYYDDGNDIVAANTGKYLVNWYFRGQEINDHLYEVYGNGEYDNVLSAQISTEPSLPELITSHAFLVGRVIVQVGTYSGLAETSFTTTFQATAVTAHNDLSSKQGGQANEYYHLDSNQYNNLVVADGLQTVGQTLEWDGIYWKSVSIVGVTGSQGESGPTGSTGFFNGDVATFSQIKATFSYFGTNEVNPTSWVDIEGSNLSYSSLRVRQGVEPTSPNDGDIYYDGTHSYFRIGSIWSQLDNEPNDPNTITVAKEGGQFLTIKEAVDSITTASASNTFVVKVRAGVYLEDTITMKSYVAIVGESSISTIIQANDPNQTLINLVDQSAVFDCQIQGCTGTGVAAVVYSSTTTPQTNAIAYVENVRFGTNYTHAKVIGTASGNCIMQCSNVKYGGYPFTIGFQATNDGTGVGRMQLRNVTSTNGGITTTSGLIFAKADAQGCGFIVNGCLLTKSVGAADGIGFQVENGGFLRLTGVNFQRWSKAIYAPVDSGAPSIDAIALNFENNTIDVQIDNTSATGKIQGVDNYSKTIISPTASLYVVNKDQKRIIVAKKGGDFSSIKSAVESITDSSDTNRYVVEVGPGVFYEGMIDLSNKPYVSIVGSNIQTTQIFASFSNHHLFKMGLANEISFLSLSEVGSGYAAIFADDSGDFSQAHKLSFYNCDIGISVRSATQETLFYGEYVDFNGTYTSAVVVDSNGSNFRCFANIENFYTFPSSGGSVAASVKDTFGELKVSVASLTGAGLDTAFYLENGASLNVTSTEITGYEYGLDNPDIGTFSTFVFNGVNIDESVVFPLRVKQPLTDGLFSGTIHDHTTIENDSPNVYWTFLDQIDGELNVTRKLSVTFVDNTTTDLTTLVFETAPMGVLEGGEISIDIGLLVNVSAGYGYLQVINSPTHKRIDWPVSQISLPANSSNYIYINENENLVYNASLPDISQNILLGRVVTTNSSILLIDNTRVDSEHATNKLNLFNRRALGAIYESGSIVTTAGSQSMNITPGSYWFGESNFTPTGGLTVSFSQFIRDGLGDWIISMTNSVTNQFDNNSGSLITMSASYFTKHTLYVVGELVDEQYLLVVGQTQYLNLVDAESAGLSNPPSYFEDGVVPISAIYVQEGNSSIYQIEDIRPVLGFKSSGVNASSDHGNLLGLSDDDHPQYLLSDGSRSMTGNLQMGSNSIAGVSQVNGVTVESHHTRHLPGGADALTVGIPSSIGTVSSEGVLNSFVRQDHIHAHGDLPGGTLHDVATSISSGFLSSTDKQFIDSIPTDYLKNIGGTVSGKLHVSGTVSSPSITITGTASINNLSISGRLIDQSGSSGNNGEILKSTATGSLWYPNKGSFGLTIDGSGQDITTGEKGYVVLPYDGEITGWDIIASATCSCVVDLWKSTSIPTVANTITGSEKPTLTNQQKNNDYALSTWTTLFSEGDIISFNVDSLTNCQRVTIIIKINKK